MTGDLIKVHIDLPNHWGTGGESLWARDLGDDLYEIENVPFYAYGINYNDVVRAVAKSPDLKPEVLEVIRHSGHRTLRIMFMNERPAEKQNRYLSQIRELGGSPERATAYYLSIDVPPAADYEALCDLLSKFQYDYVLEYETCEERIAGSFDDRPAD
jgi:hypothetical protein